MAGLQLAQAESCELAETASVLQSGGGAWRRSGGQALARPPIRESPRPWSMPTRPLTRRRPARLVSGGLNCCPGCPQACSAARQPVPPCHLPLLGRGRWPASHWQHQCLPAPAWGQCPPLHPPGRLPPRQTTWHPPPPPPQTRNPGRVRPQRTALCAHHHHPRWSLSRVRAFHRRPPGVGLRPPSRPTPRLPRWLAKAGRPTQLWEAQLLSAQQKRACSPLLSPMTAAQELARVLARVLAP